MYWILLDITSTQTTKKLNSSLVFLITSHPYFGFLVVCVVSCSISWFHFGVLCLVCRNFFYVDVAEEDDTTTP